jgi:excinuclease UvrABC nuclease subunit
MPRKTTKYDKTSIQKLPDDKPAVYRIQTEGGKDNYVGIAKRGRVTERIAEHLGDVPGATVKIEQHSSIQDAQASEAQIIKQQQPKYNKDGK